MGLVTVMFLAFAVPPLLSRIRVVRIPIAVGEILAGVIVGRSGLNLLTTDVALDVLQFLGLLYLMFAAGLEVDFQALSGNRSEGSGSKNGSGQGLLARLHHPLIIGIAFHLITVALAYWWVMNGTDRALLPHPLGFALLMSTVGFSIIMPVLKETNRLSTPFGQVIVGVAAIGDFAPVVAITVLITLQRGGTLLDVVLLAALFLVAYLFYRLGRRFRNIEFFEGLTRGDRKSVV